MRSIYGDEQRFIESYFKKTPGKYLTGDVAREDTNGYYWISGPDDDIIEVLGHRLGTGELENWRTGELESAFLPYPAASEAAVVAIPHEITGQAIYAYVSLKQSVFSSDELKVELIQHARATIDSLATPQTIQWVRDLPKTRSGRIIRLTLRHVAANE
jgi:acetyl-CoA synthetase